MNPSAAATAATQSRTPGGGTAAPGRSDDAAEETR